uniref:Uncharacterized protein n=1 Tax=Lepeophtheirus salmonis TaxID=72036 RepID=A0A0K2TEZ4_LEPSM
MHLHSAIIHLLNMDFINYFWSSNLHKAYRTFMVTCAHMAISKILKSLLNCSNSTCKVIIIFIKLLFSLLGCFVVHKVMFNQPTKLFFIHFLKITSLCRFKQMPNRKK